MIERHLGGPKLVPAVFNGQAVYSQVVVSDRKTVVFIAGQLARNEQGELVGKSDARAQMRQVCENLKAALAIVGATLDDLVQTNTYVTSIEVLIEAGDIRQEYFGVGLPTSTTVVVKSLAGSDFMVEISGIAMLD